MGHSLTLTFPPTQRFETFYEVVDRAAAVSRAVYIRTNDPRGLSRDSGSSPIEPASLEDRRSPRRSHLQDTWNATVLSPTREKCRGVRRWSLREAASGFNARVGERPSEDPLKRSQARSRVEILGINEGSS